MNDKSQVTLSYADIYRYCPSDWNRRIVSDSNLTVLNSSRIFTFVPFQPAKNSASRQFAGSAGSVLNPGIIWLNVCGSVMRTRNEDYDDNI